jgi:hypothetical protein
MKLTDIYNSIKEEMSDEDIVAILKKQLDPKSTVKVNKPVVKPNVIIIDDEDKVDEEFKRMQELAGLIDKNSYNITEISIEQLKTQFVDSGKIDQKSFDEITGTTPKSAYITWLLKKIIDKTIKLEDAYKYKKYFMVFDRRKKEYPYADINQYKSPQDIAEFIKTSIDILDKESKDSSQQKGVAKSDKYKEFYIGTVEGFDVYKLPKDRKDLYGASCELGSGTEWCTATGKTRMHFDEYIENGPLFIFIKPNSKEKYQFSYEEKQFMDKNDNPIENESYIYEFFKFIKEKYPKYDIPLKYILLFDPESLTPNDLNIKGDLNLSDIPLTSLPDNLNIKGDLFIRNTNISQLPKSIKPNYIEITGTPFLKKYLDKYKKSDLVISNIIKDYPNLKNTEIDYYY